MEQATLLIQCPDQTGIVSRISTLLYDAGANITKSDQYTTDPDGGLYFMRVEFCFARTDISREDLEFRLTAFAETIDAVCRVHYEEHVTKMAIAVSKFDHCLADILYRVRSGDLRVEIPFVLSNHDKVRKMVEQEGIPFHHLPVTKETKGEQEDQMLEILKESDFLVMARYMQILSDDFLTRYGRDVINIHHSFLPSFKGANPYKQAYERGVKIIGATAHYATLDLDEGPIIEQKVSRVTHSDTVDGLKKKGRNLEQLALASAIHAHIEHRVIRYRNKTVVFD
jgi:formyltetrahydrofolate deformylase